MIRYFHNGNAMTFSTSSGEVARFDSSGRVLINNGVNLSAADADDLQVGNTTGAHGITIVSSSSHNGNLFFGDNAHNDAGSIRYNHPNNRMEFFTNRTSQVIIDSSGRVAIGTTSPETALDVLNGGNTYTSGLLLRNGTSLSEATSLYHDNQGFTTTVLANRYGNAGSSIKLVLQAASASPVTALTALGNGNVLIGKTADNDTSAGIRFQSNGSGSFVRDNNVALKVNRLNGNGSLIEFRKDSNLVGSIAASDNTSSDLIIFSAVADHVGLRFGNTRLQPTNNSGTTTDGVCDLGFSNSKFKDAHFSGTVNSNGLSALNSGSGDCSVQIKSTSAGDPKLIFDSAAANRSGVIQFRDQGANIGRIEYVNNGDRIDMRAGSATGITMSVTNSGVIIGSTTPSKTLKLEFSDTNTSTTNGGTKGLEIKNTATATNTYAPIHFHANQSFGRIALKNVDGNEEISQFEFIVADDGSAINAMTIGSTGNVTITGSCTATSFPTSSDARLKENIEDADDSGTAIDSLLVRQFDWKSNGKHEDYGMIAQEVIHTCPNAVSVPQKDGEMMGIDYSKMVPLLLKEIQELRKRVKKLEE